MNKYTDNVHEDGLELITDLRDQAIKLSIAERGLQEEIDAKMRIMLNEGVSIDALSDASGIPPAQIRSRVGELAIDRDLSSISGIY